MTLLIIAGLPIALMLMLAIIGCSPSMATVRSAYKDTSIIRISADRAAVIDQLGAPDASAEVGQGGHIDIYLIDPDAHTARSKRSAVLFHLFADIMTYGLWEIVGTPLELAAQDKPMTFVLKYDKGGKLVETETVGEWRPLTVSEDEQNKCHLYASVRAMAVPELDDIQGAFTTNKLRDTAYQLANYNCLLGIYVARSG